MKLLLLGSAAVAVAYAATRVIWQGGNAELGAGLAVIVAAICAGSAAIVEAIDRCRPRPVSGDNGGGPRKDSPGG